MVSKEELAAVTKQNGGNFDNLFSKVDTNDNGLISRAEGETFGNRITNQIQQKENANSGTNDISGIGQGWKSEMFNALLKILSSTTSSTGESTSLYT